MFHVHWNSFFQHLPLAFGNKHHQIVEFPYKKGVENKTTVINEFQTVILLIFTSCDESNPAIANE